MAFGGLKGTLTGTGASTGATNAISGSVAVRIGDLVFAVSAEQTALTSTTVIDNLGNTYTAQNAGNDAGTMAARSYWSRVTVAGTLTAVTVTNTLSANRWCGFAAVIEGPFALSPLDANPANTTNDLTSPYPSPATGTLAQAPEVVIAWFCSDASDVISATSPNLLAGQSSSGTNPRASIGYQAVNVTTTISPAFTTTLNAATATINGTASFRAALLPMGWAPLNEQPRRKRWRANASAIFFVSGFAAFAKPPVGWENQAWQPFRTRRKIGTPPGNNPDDVFVSPVVATPAWQFSTQEFQPPGPRIAQRGAAFPDDVADFNDQTPLVNFYPAGWEIQSHQPKHPRPENAGAIAAGDDGDEYPFIFTVVTPAWQFSAQEFQPPAARVWKRGAVFPDDASGFNDQPPLLNFYPAGWEVQAVQPPHPRPERFGAIAPREDGIERPFANFYPMGWEVQPPQPLQPPVGRESIRGGGLMRGDDGTVAPYVVQLAAGWEIQSVQPPRFLPWYRRAAALMIGDDGTYQQYASWRNFEWGVQNFQPPHPHPERYAAIAPKDDGITATYSVWRNAGWEIAAPNPQHLRRLLILNIDAVFVAPAFTPPFGWENQPPQPPRFPFANRRAGAIMPKEDGTEAGFAFWYNFGWEVQPPPPPRRRWERFAAIALGDDGVQYPLLRFLGFGFENQPPQPPHPRPERSASIMRGDDGNQGTFAFVAPPPWGFEQPYLFPRYAPPQRWAALAGPENIPGVMLQFYQFGFENQPSQPLWPRVRHGAAIQPGDPNHLPSLLRFVPMGWEPTPPLFRHPRPELAGAIMAGDSGAEAPFVARIATGWGFEPPAFALRRAIGRAGGLAGRAEGTDAPFQFFRPMGWEPSEPIRRPRRGWHGPQIFEPPGYGLLPFQTPRWIDARIDQLKPRARLGGALAGPWLVDRVEAKAFTLAGLDWWPPETFYRRRRVGGALPSDGGWMLPRFVSVFYASSVLTRASGLVTATQGRGESLLTRAGAAPDVSQASGQTATTAAVGKTVVKGEQRGQ